VWSKGSKEAGSSGTDSEVFPVWKGGTQEVGVFRRKREEKRGGGATTQSVEESEGA